MLEYDRIDVSEDIETNKTNGSSTFLLLVLSHDRFLGFNQKCVIFGRIRQLLLL